jgi:membrane-bound serine protease (ClpP class)
MKVVLFSLLLAIGGALGDEIDHKKDSPLKGKVVHLKINDESLLEDEKVKGLNSFLKRANAEKARAIVLELNSQGGAAWSSMEFASKIAETSLPTVAYVNKSAIGVACLLALSCDQIYMAPHSLIGNSAIVRKAGEDDLAAFREKINQKTLGWIEANLGKHKQRKALAEIMMVTTKEERKIASFVIPPGGIHSLRADEAVRLVNGKPLLADGELGSLREVLKKEGLDSDEIVRFSPR